MHYTGTIWRPPYEASSLLIEVTAGCTHHKCKFCTLYADLPFKFRMSPLEDIEQDLAEVQSGLRSYHSQKVNRVTHLEKLCKTQSETDLRHYRKNLRHL
jgi:radical SAM superfamily enzyme YgiQ (UPF0313 family)